MYLVMIRARIRDKGRSRFSSNISCRLAELGAKVNTFG